MKDIDEILLNGIQGYEASDDRLFFSVNEIKQRLLSIIKASLPERNGTETHEQDKGWNACLTQVEQELNKLFGGK